MNFIISLLLTGMLAGSAPEWKRVIHPGGIGKDVPATKMWGIGKSCVNDWSTKKVYGPVDVDFSEYVDVVKPRAVKAKATWILRIYNAGDRVLHDVVLEVNVEPTHNKWHSMGWTSCDNLAPRDACIYNMPVNSFPYIRVRAKAQGKTKLVIWFMSDEK